MLPDVTLEDVSRDDVDRVAWWLEDDEISSRWFGHYGCGDPVHRGYDPNHMLEASDWEWQSVFGDPHRRIFSIYSDEKEHVGEAQFLLDGKGGAELSLLIGRKDLWHHGYGTGTVLLLLLRVFKGLDLSRAWVNVPEGNEAALGLFEKLGFHREADRDLCVRSDGSPLRASILSIDSSVYQANRPGKGPGREPVPVLAVTGLPGSGSAEIGAEVAKLLGFRFVDDEFVDMLGQRLRCSPREVVGFEASHGSFWRRILNAIVVPMEWSATYDAGHHLFRRDLDYDILQQTLTKERYLKGLKAIVMEICAQGHTVLHGHGGHAFVTSGENALNVFVSSSTEARARRIASELEFTVEEAAKWLRRADAEVVSVSRHLLGSDLTDVGGFDITVNVDRLSTSAAAEMIVGALQTAPLRQGAATSVQAAMETVV